MINWGLHIKRLRQEYGMIQEELAHASGLSRSYLATIEMGRYKTYRGSTLAKLAKGFKISPSQLTAEIEGKIEQSPQVPENIEGLLRRALITFPDTVPIYDPKEFALRLSGPVEPSDFIYRRKYPEYKNVVGCYAYGHCLEPEILDGDILIVDDNTLPGIGDIAVCLIDDKLHTGRIELIENERYLVNHHGQIKLSQCQKSWLIIEIRRRLK